VNILFQETSSQELGVWSDNDKEKGWEDELLLDEGEVIQSTETVMKENRKQERNSRRQTNNYIRSQQRTALYGPSLGVKQS